MTWRRLLSAVLVSLALTAGTTAGVAQACPMCKQANATDSNRPKAYMYSILFMLAMPATVFTGFCVGFYRLSKKQQALRDADSLEGPECETGANESEDS